MNNYLN